MSLSMATLKGINKMKTSFKVNAAQWQEFDLLTKQLCMRRDRFLDQNLWVNPVVCLYNPVLELDHKIAVTLCTNTRNILRLDGNNHSISRDMILQQTLYKLVARLTKRLDC